LFTILEDKPVDSYKRQEFKNHIILPESQAQFVAYAQSPAALWRIVAKKSMKPIFIRTKQLSKYVCRSDSVDHGKSISVGNRSDIYKQHDLMPANNEFAPQKDN
jgi:hypothetical protein